MPDVDGKVNTVDSKDSGTICLELVIPVLNSPDPPPAAIPVSAEPSPANDVAVSAPDEELKVKLLPLLGGKSPVAAVVNIGKQVVSDDSSATGIVVAAGKLVKLAPEPLNDVAVITPVALIPVNVG